MAGWCLVPQAVSDFKAKLRDGSIDPIKMAQMTSEERHKLLEEVIGKDNATQVNSLFESKLLLKNQKAGYIAWAKKVAGLTTEARRDLISKIERMDRILNPEEEKAFLKDLATTRLGADVTQEEAKTIFELSQKVKEAKSLRKEDLTFNSEAERMAYGRAKVALGNYVNDLKEQTKKLNFTDRLKPENYLKDLSDVAGNAKSLKASLDNSAIFRQGWKTLWTNPLIWQKNARKTFADIWHTFGGQKVMDELNADIISRPNYERMVKAKLAVGTIEEAYPGTVAEKIPLAGRLYKASENAFTGFVYRQRADIFDKYIEIAKRSGVNVDDKFQLESIGKLVNSMTGRGHLGALEPAANTFNNVFFSPRLFKSHIDTLLLHPTDKMSGFARKEAAINLVKIITGTAAILGIAKVINPDSVDFDPRSADFGKIKVGNTRFDVSGGMSSVVTLAARLITMSSKSSTTGRISPINSGEYGAQTGTDVVYNFFENKLSPAAAIVKDLLKGEDFKGNKPTVQGEISNLVVPISVTNYQELSSDPNAANILVSMLADGLGIGTNTYGKSTKKWNQQPTKAQQAFKDKVGETKFNTANDEFNSQYDSWFARISKTESYKNLSDDNKQSLTTQYKDQLQERIFKKYGFIYKQAKETPTQKKQKAQVKQLLH